MIYKRSPVLILVLALVALLSTFRDRSVNAVEVDQVTTELIASIEIEAESAVFGEAFLAVPSDLTFAHLAGASAESIELILIDSEYRTASAFLEHHRGPPAS